MSEYHHSAHAVWDIKYHQGGGTAVDGLFDDLWSRYSGLFAIARDLDVF